MIKKNIIFCDTGYKFINKTVYHKVNVEIIKFQH